MMYFPVWKRLLFPSRSGIALSGSSYPQLSGMTYNMAQILCIANQKGGVGKTTTAVNLAAGLGLLGKKTLLVDSDSQANATTGLGINKNSLKKTLYHGLIGEVDAKSIILDTDIEALKMIPSRIELIGFEVEMMSSEGREGAMERLLSQVWDDFEYIIIDCPPSLSLLTVNAMTVADSVLIPLQSEFYALEGLSQLLQTIERIRQTFNPGLKICGILLTMFDQRTNLSRQVAEEAQNYFKGKERVFKTMIPRNVRLGEAPGFGKPILLYDPGSVGARSYFALAEEISAG